ncbi:MAG TPA: hypothetical protein VE033_13620 [Acetobacteraceae bacterium]|nr:hypothetical protein [Acetobacteraceae bacterium]
MIPSRILALALGVLPFAAATAALAMTFEPPRERQAPPAQAVAPALPQPRPAPPAARVRPAPRPLEPGMIADPRTGCAVWVPDAQPGEAVQHAGGCGPDGLASGAGEFVRILGGTTRELYQGNFAAGRLNGPGVRVGADGDRLEAEFRDGLANGRGVLRYGANARVYEGEFRDGLPHGRGVMTSPTGARYEGDWARGQRQGQGTMTSHEGTYVGTWRADQRSGRGRMTYADGRVYEGDWVDGQRQGHGIYRWTIGQHSGVYTGGWLADRRHGFGTEVFTTQGVRIEGDFVADRPEGRVVYIAGQQRFEGEMRDGCLRSGGRVWRVMAGTGLCQ